MTDVHTTVVAAVDERTTIDVVAFDQQPLFLRGSRVDVDGNFATVHAVVANSQVVQTIAEPQVTVAPWRCHTTVLVAQIEARHGNTVCLRTHQDLTIRRSSGELKNGFGTTIAGVTRLGGIWSNQCDRLVDVNQSCIRACCYRHGLAGTCHINTTLNTRARRA